MPASPSPSTPAYPITLAASPLRAFDVVVVTNELDLYETTDDDERPRGEEGEELDDAAIRYVHRVAPSAARGLGGGVRVVWIGAPPAPPGASLTLGVTTCTIA